MTLRAGPVLLLIVATTIAAPRLKDKDNDNAWFPTKEGTTLVYQLGASEQAQVVTKVEQKNGEMVVHVSNVDPDGKLHLQMVVLVAKKGLFMLEEVGQKYDPPWCMLSLPAKAGETWEIKTRRPDIGLIEMTCTVEKPEQLTVPAGKLTTIPVAVTRLSHNGIAKPQLYYWYAPDIGWAKIQKGDVTARELKSIKPGVKK